MNINDEKRILFFVNDFKTDRWGAELKKYNYNVVSRERRFLSHIKIIVTGHFKNKRIDAFIFRYLNDHESLSESTLYLLRDILIISLCKAFRIKILWILHNIDRETKENYPFLIHLRKILIGRASKKVLVTDPALIEVGRNYGIDAKKIDWLCFGKPKKKRRDQKNIDLKRRITGFKEQLKNNKTDKVYLGLCVSRPAEKKLHYLFADSIVGVVESKKGSTIALVFIGKFPNGRKFVHAKERVKKSPYILFIEDSFEVDELYISDQIDFFYRSLNDQSVPYSLYVAADLAKPMVSHNYGALPLLLNKEKLGLILDENEGDYQVQIADCVDKWSPDGAENFLRDRSWKIAAKQLLKAIEE